ncbi:MAG: hypothetical protein AAFW98_00215 [Pseudomonadota bacterium]
MGWQLSTVATPLEGRPLAEVAGAVIGRRVELEPGRPDNLFMPGDGLWAVSAGERAWLFSETVFDDFVSRRINPQREMAGFALHSVVNAYGFALWREDGFVRRRFGAAPTGALARSVILDDGAMLPEEIEAVRALGRDDRDIASAEIAEAIWREPRIIEEPVDHSLLGDTVVFAMLSTFCGLRDEGAFFDLIETAEPFRVKRSGALSRLRSGFRR